MSSLREASTGNGVRDKQTHKDRTRKRTDLNKGEGNVARHKWKRAEAHWADHRAVVLAEQREGGNATREKAAA